MLIVCHLSYQDSEAIVHMKQHAIIPTEQQYSHNATEALIKMPNCSNSMIGALCQLSYPSPNLPSCVNFVDEW